MQSNTFSGGSTPDTYLKKNWAAVHKSNSDQWPSYPQTLRPRSARSRSADHADRFIKILSKSKYVPIKTLVNAAQRTDIGCSSSSAVMASANGSARRSISSSDNPCLSGSPDYVAQRDPPNGHTRDLAVRCEPLLRPVIASSVNTVLHSARTASFPHPTNRCCSRNTSWART